jgi:hypothetical protein
LNILALVPAGLSGRDLRNEIEYDGQDVSNSEVEHEELDEIVIPLDFGVDNQTVL